MGTQRDTSGTLRQSGGTTDGGKFAAERLAEQGPAGLTRATAPAEPRRYIAPDHPALKQLINVDGKIQTWAQFLEDLNPAGTELGLASMRSSRIATFASSRDGGHSYRLPAAVVKAAALKDITTPVERARVKMQSAEMALHNAEDRNENVFSTQTDPKMHELRVRDNQAKWEYEAVLNEEAAKTFARDGFAPVQEALDFQKENGYWNPSTTRILGPAVMDDEDLAVELLSHRDRYGKTVLRADLGAQFRHQILNHPSAKVRVAAIENGLIGTSGSSFSLLQEYIGRYPQPEILEAANGVSPSPTGKYRLEGDHVVYEDREARTWSSVPLKSAAKRFDMRAESPRARQDRTDTFYNR